MDPRRIFELYEAGVEYKSSIGLYSAVDKNERFFAGDQWAGVNAPDLPKPVVNFIKRACQQRVAEVNENPVGVSFEAVEFPNAAPGAVPDAHSDAPKGGKIHGRAALSDGDTQILDAMFDADWNRMKLDAVNLDGLLDAAVTGDYLLYCYWDGAAETGQAASGCVCAERLDSVCYYPGNPNSSDVQRQPNIIVARLEPVADVKTEAAKYGRPAAELDAIAEGGGRNLESGDLSHLGLAGATGEKCVTLLYMFKDGRGRVMAQKSTREAVVRPLWDTGLSRYPLSLMNWEVRRGCCHGRAEVTGLVPVQRYVNQMYAMAMLYTMQSACPKAVFNQGMVKAWSNAVGAAVPVNGDIASAVKYLEPPRLSEDIYDLPEQLMDTTLKLIGVGDIELGSVNPTNMSALVMAREASTMTVQSIKTRFYSMIEDFARNWLDMVAAYAIVPRWLKLGGEGGPRTAVFDPGILRGRLWSVKVDVGAASAWSEINSVATLGSLYNSGVIDARQYVERLPDGYLPLREKLLGELSAKPPAKPEKPLPTAEQDA